MCFASIYFKAGKCKNAAVRVDGNLRGGATERQKISLETGADPQQGRQRTILYRDNFPKISLSWESFGQCSFALGELLG